MVRKGIALLLILFIGLSPVMSAFAYCQGLDDSKNAHPSSPSVPAVDLAVMPVTHDRQEADGHGNHSNVSCHAGATCAFHLCGGLGLTGSISFTALLLSNQHPPSIQASLNGRTFAPELEPPIRIL